MQELAPDGTPILRSGPDDNRPMPTAENSLPASGYYLNGVKVYSCGACPGQTFENMDALRVHREEQHPDKLWHLVEEQQHQVFACARGSRARRQ